LFSAQSLIPRTASHLQDNCAGIAVSVFGSFLMLQLFVLTQFLHKTGLRFCKNCFSFYFYRVFYLKIISQFKEKRSQLIAAIILSS